jgi:hypothetical protein
MLYGLRTAVFLGVVLNGINEYTSGHSIFSQQQKDPFRIEYRDGTSQQLFKHATEALEWARDPAKTAKNKMAFLPSEAINQLYGSEFVGSQRKMDTSISGRVAHATRGFVPFTAKPFLDPDLTPQEAAIKAAKGLVSQSYGYTDEQKLRRDERRREERLRLLMEKFQMEGKLP